MKISTALLMLGALLVRNTQSLCMQQTPPLLTECSQDQLKSAGRLIVMPTDHQNELGQTALMRAVMRGDVALAKSLINNYKASIELKDTRGWTALHYAASKLQEIGPEREACAQILIQQNANIDAQTKIGSTALHLATLAGLDDLAALLVASKANTMLKDTAGLTALDYAKAKKNEKLISLLQNLETSPSTDQKETPTTKLCINVLSRARERQQLYTTSSSESDSPTPQSYISSSHDDGEEETEELVNL